MYVFISTTFTLASSLNNTRFKKIHETSQTTIEKKNPIQFHLEKLWNDVTPLSDFCTSLEKPKSEQGLVKLFTSYNIVSFDLEACSWHNKQRGAVQQLSCCEAWHYTSIHWVTLWHRTVFFFKSLTPLSSHPRLLLPTTSQQPPFQKDPPCPPAGYWPVNSAIWWKPNVYMWVLLVELQQ